MDLHYDPFADNPCNNCKAGRANEENARDLNLPIPIERNPVEERRPRTNETQDHNGGKEEKRVANKKDAILARIEKEKVCSRGRLTCFCAVTAQELDVAVKELEAEGKIQSWPKGRVCFYTPPGAPDPRGAAETGNNRQQPAAAGRKPQESSTPPIKSRANRAAPERPLPAARKSGSGNGSADLAFIGILQEKVGGMLIDAAEGRTIGRRVLDLAGACIEHMEDRGEVVSE